MVKPHPASKLAELLDSNVVTSQGLAHEVPVPVVKHVPIAKQLPDCELRWVPKGNGTAVATFGTAVDLRWSLSIE
jgi:hypothetical protein